MTREEVVQQLLAVGANNERVRRLMALDILSMLLREERLPANLERSWGGYFRTLVETYHADDGSDAVRKLILERLQEVSVFKDYVNYFIGGRVDDSPYKPYNMPTYERNNFNGGGVLGAIAAMNNVSLEIYQSRQQVGGTVLLERVFSYQHTLGNNRLVSLLHMSQYPENPKNLNHFQLLEPGGVETNEAKNKKLNDKKNLRDLTNNIKKLDINVSQAWERDGDDSSDEEDSDVWDDIELTDLLQKSSEVADDQRLINNKFYVHLSFILHKLGIKLLKSSEVDQEYRRLKAEKLLSIDTISNEAVDACIRRSVMVTYQYFDGNNVNQFLLEQELQISEFANQTKQNKRTLFRNAKKGRIRFMLPAPILVLDQFWRTFNYELYFCLKNLVTKRSTLPDAYTINLKEGDSPIKFLAHIRLMKTSIIRMIKNLNPSYTPIIGQKTVSRFLSFPSIKDNEAVLETQTIIKTSCIRKDKVQDHERYSSICSKIETIKLRFRVSDGDIARWIQKTFQGFNEEMLLGDGEERADLRRFINALTYLLFGTEASRNPASLLVHCMVLELIMVNQLTWKEVLGYREGRAFVNGKLPMSIKGAVKTSRWLHRLYPDVLSSASGYEYDKVNNLPLFPSPEAMATIINLIRLEGEIFERWLALYNIRLMAVVQLIDLNKLEIFTELEDLIKRWYSVSILSRQLSIDQIRSSNLNSHILCLEYLFTNQLLILASMLENNLGKRINKLLDIEISVGTDIESIIEVYKQYPDPDRFRELTEDDVIEALERGEYFFEEFSDWLERNEKEFWNYVDGEDNDSEDDDDTF